jgi:hypothetical protein
MEYNYQLRGVEKTADNVESVKFFAYSKSDGTDVPEVTAPVVTAENGDAFRCSGEGAKRVYYLVKTPITEEETKE